MKRKLVKWIIALSGIGLVFGYALGLTGCWLYALGIALMLGVALWDLEDMERKGKR